MKLTLFSLPILLTLSGMSAQDHRPIALTHVTVIDMTGGPAKPDMTVVIERDHVVQLAPAGTARVPVKAETVDATGKYLIPGLWDMHVHGHVRSTSEHQ